MKKTSCLSSTQNDAYFFSSPFFLVAKNHSILCSPSSPPKPTLPLPTLFFLNPEWLTSFLIALSLLYRPKRSFLPPYVFLSPSFICCWVQVLMPKAWSRNGMRLEERGQCRPVFTTVDVSVHGSKVRHVWSLEGAQVVVGEWF